MNLTKDFKCSEFACKDSKRTPYPIKHEDRLMRLAVLAQLARNALGCPISVNSAYRTPAHNKRVGGKPASQHVQGRAVDLSPLVAPSKKAEYNIKLRDWALSMKDVLAIGGIGFYRRQNFCHIDIRPRRPGQALARWNG